MKRFICTMAGALVCLSLYAQTDLFVFIQQVSGQPFYARMGEKSYSSSAGGHLILGGLRDSTYRIYLGFPRSAAPEQLFEVPLQKDRGFELKKVNGGWRLADLQSDDMIEAVATAQSAGAPVVKRTDSYSLLMAGVVDDSAVLYSVAKKDTVPLADTIAKTVVAKRMGPKGKPKTAVTQKAVKKDSAAAGPPVAAPDLAATPAKDTLTTGLPAAAEAKKDIIRFGTENLEEGKLIIYIDRTGPIADTVRIVIPRI